MIMGVPTNIEVGGHVWVEDPLSAWIDGQISETSGDEAIIETSSGEKISSKLSKLYPKDMGVPEEGVDDMTKLSYLHEPGVMQNLATRFQFHKVYTYTGNILIALNPFQKLPELYDTKAMELYKGKPLGDLIPHVFAVADVSYRAMIDERKNNSILVSGESGAGKTETTKMIMQYLAFLGGHSFATGRTVEQQVLESNPVLEAFGNAKTTRNNNSSRFGKFVQIQFDNHGKISGAAIRTYLLERSRVCQISDPERNYHCFYLLCAAPPEEVEKYKLGHPSSFHYLNQSNCYEVDGRDDAHEYLATRKAMSIVGITEAEQDAIFRVVAAILHLGNIDFSHGEEMDSSVLKDEKSKYHLEMTAQLLMCDPIVLEDALRRRVMITPEEIIKKSLDPVGAAVSRDGLAKTTYSRLFDWLVEKINCSIGQDPSSKYHIGVLDIYGFESFKFNSFEQFCINYTNEKLQQHFNQHIFKMEQEIYAKEGIDWSYVEFIDNQDILDLIEKKPGGIIALLDEACMFPRSNHETFSEKLYQSFRSHRRFIKPKLTRTDFTIVHYAGEVQYQSDQFLDKNKDYVVPEHQDLLSSSRCPFIVSLFPRLSEDAMKSAKFSSLGSRFKLQLQQLMETLNSTKPHYIRCVKPNNDLKPFLFDNVSVMQQLRSGGVLEAIRIKCAGYPTHKTFHGFLKRFGILAPKVLEVNNDEKEACIAILEKVGLREVQIGETKIFLRAGQMAELDALREKALGNFAKRIQKQYRAHVARKQYVALRNGSVHVQSLWRVRMAARMYMTMKKDAAAKKIQKFSRGNLARKAYNQQKSATISLQATWRMILACKKLKSRRQANAAIIMQSYWRRHRDLSYYNQLKARMEEREASVHIDEKEPILEERERFVYLSEEKEHNLVEELRRQLEIEKRSRAEMEEKQKQEVERLQYSLQAMRSKVDEATALLFNEREIAQKILEDARQLINPVKDSVMDAETIRGLQSEVEYLKASVRIEKQRAYDFEGKYLKAQKSCEEQSRKFEETETRVRQLENLLNRMLSAVSDQLSELKCVLGSSSPSSMIAARDDQDDGFDLSDTSSSSDSDFTFPAPTPSAPLLAHLHPNALKLIVQDITEDPGTKREGEKEPAFDDFF